MKLIKAFYKGLRRSKLALIFIILGIVFLSFGLISLTIVKTHYNTPNNSDTEFVMKLK